MPHYGCCDCQPLVCGNHVIRPCRVSMLQQVPNRSGRDGDGRLWIVRMQETVGQSIFLDDQAVGPLLHAFNIPQAKVPVIPVDRRSPRSKTGADDTNW